MTEKTGVACSHCKTALAPAAHFCFHCGAPADGAWSPESEPNFLQSLLNLARGLSATLDVDALLKKISQAAETMFLCEAASIMLLDDDKAHLYFKVATGEKGGLVTRFKVKLGEGIAGTVGATMQPMLINDVAADKRFNAQFDKLSGFQTKSALCVPMTANGELVGVLEVLNKKIPAGFSAADQGLLESLASLAALAIVNARVLGGFRNFYANTIEILITAIESRDMRMAGHCWRVAQRASTVGRQLGLDGQALKDLYYAALLHDIGFVKVAGGWNSGRVLIMESPHQEQTHALIGAEMIRGIHILAGAATLITYHHENYDGSGFPKGLKGSEIPLSGHILSVLEATEEMRMSGMSEEQVAAALKDGSGTKFHPEVAEACRQFFVFEDKVKKPA
jgi:HD-GYP domain-containing protein (c-di-GMP phosphodiesterase class II)